MDTRRGPMVIVHVALVEFGHVIPVAIAIITLYPLRMKAVLVVASHLHLTLRCSFATTPVLLDMWWREMLIHVFKAAVALPALQCRFADFMLTDRLFLCTFIANADEMIGLIDAPSVFIGVDRLRRGRCRCRG